MFSLIRCTHVKKYDYTPKIVVPRRLNSGESQKISLVWEFEKNLLHGNVAVADAIFQELHKQGKSPNYAFRNELQAKPIPSRFIVRLIRARSKHPDFPTKAESYVSMV